MDLITQAVLGGAVGYAVAGKKLGRTSIHWGIIGGIIPDLDMLLVWSLGPFAEFQFHRGFTHGLIFDIVVGWILGTILAKRYSARGASPCTWRWLMILSIATHPLLDIFTSYGTQLFWPFSNMRVSSFAVSVIDPFYTIPLLIVLLASYAKPLQLHNLSRVMLVITTGYLFWGGYTAQQARDFAIADLGDRLPATGWQLQPQKTFGQIFLHRVIAQTPDKVFIGYVSTRNMKPITWEEHPIKKERCWAQIRNHDKVQLFEWFSGLTLPELQAEGNRYMIYDMRYGFLGESNKGVWGITVRFHPQNCEVIEPVCRFGVKRKGLLNIIAQIYQMAFS